MSRPFSQTLAFIAEETPVLMSTALHRGGALAELFVEDTLVQQVALSFRQGKWRESETRQTITGTGFRVLDGSQSPQSTRSSRSSKSWYASAPGLQPATIRKAASDVGRSVNSSRAAAAAEVRAGNLRCYDDLPADAPSADSTEEIRALLTDAADAALSLLPDLDDLEVGFQGTARRIAVASSDGRFASTSRSVVGMRVKVGRDGFGAHAVGGGAGGMGYFLEARPESIAAEAATRLYAATDAAGTMRMRGGDMPVVLAGGWGGVWLHEVIGHMLEADVFTHGASADEEAGAHLGQRIADSAVSVFDDARLATGRGGGGIDDEGTPTARIALIEKGVLGALLTDRSTANSMGLPESGSGRRQDYRFEPLPRMSNLLLAAGDDDPESLVHAAGTGLYVKMIGNGAVTPSKDSFSFDVLEGYLIESGRIGRPVTQLRISGKPSEMLKRIRGIASDLQLDPGRGVCLKKGQAVPVSVGMPSILVNKMTVTPCS